MGPKKKAGKASKGGRGSGGIIDGVPMSEMPREHLEKYTLRIRDELEREREERNFFQLERDKLRTFWEITRQQLEENRAELRNKDRALEEAEEKHQTEIKEFNERIKHLMYEHQSHLTEVKAENMVALRQEQEEYKNLEGKLIEEKEALVKKIVEEQLLHEENLRGISMENSEKVYEIREEFLEKIKELAIKSEQRVEKIREYFTLKNKTELSELEERKNLVIHKLDVNHKEALSEIKSYYSDIINNNLALITAQKEEMEEATSQKDEALRNVKRLSEENSKLVEPLKVAQKRVSELEKELDDFRKTKTSLKNIHRRFARLNQQLEETTLDRDTRLVQLEKVEAELATAKTNYATALADIQKQNGLRVQVLEKRIAALQEENEVKEMSLAQVICRANLEPRAVTEANTKIQQIMMRKTKKIQFLHVELGKAVKAHDDLLELFKTKMLELKHDQISNEPLKPRLRMILSEHSRDTESF